MAATARGRSFIDADYGVRLCQGRVGTEADHADSCPAGSRDVGLGVADGNGQPARPVAGALPCDVDEIDAFLGVAAERALAGRKNSARRSFSIRALATSPGCP